jgi:hypothetical protein
VFYQISTKQQIQFLGNRSMTEIIVRPDGKGRINLGDLSAGVSSYRIAIGDHGTLTLIPYAEIPLSEKWIFEDQDILKKVKQQFKPENAE